MITFDAQRSNDREMAAYGGTAVAAVPYAGGIALAHARNPAYCPADGPPPWQIIFPRHDTVAFITGSDFFIPKDGLIREDNWETELYFAPHEVGQYLSTDRPLLLDRDRLAHLGCYLADYLNFFMAGYPRLRAKFAGKGIYEVIAFQRMAEGGETLCGRLAFRMTHEQRVIIQDAQSFGWNDQDGSGVMIYSGLAAYWHSLIAGTFTWAAPHVQEFMRNPPSIHNTSRELALDVLREVVGLFASNTFSIHALESVGPVLLHATSNESGQPNAPWAL